MTLRRPKATLLLLLALLAFPFGNDFAHAHAYVYEKWRLPWSDWTTGQAYKITGYRYGQGTHTGLDAYALDFGDGVDATNKWPVTATIEGTVVEVSDSGTGYGVYVDIQHVDNSNQRSRYAHLDVRYFGLNAHVEQGQIIGRAGNTGNASGIHLHFRIIRTDTQPNQAVPPEPMSGHSDFNTYTGNWQSDNVMPGDGHYTWPGGWPTHYGAIRDAFDRAVPDSGAQFQRGWIKKGSTWDPCGGNGSGYCQWVHRWGPGWVQDLRGPDPGHPNYHGHGTGRGVLMWLDGTPTAWWVHGVIWDQYLALGGGEYGSVLGYPVEDEKFWFVYFGVPLYRQRFQAGCIWFNTNDLGTNWDYYYSGSPCGN